MRRFPVLKWRMLLLSVILLFVMVLPSLFSPVLNSPFSVDKNAGGTLSYADSDGDGIPDVKEIYDYGTNPYSNDSDGDGMPDGWELENRQWIESAGVWTLDPTSPLDARQDTDNDALPNYAEFLNGTSPANPDTDGDGMPDGWEVFNGLDPLNPDDAAGDMDSDGLPNLSEYLNHTGASNPDTDGDGLLDGSEVSVYHTNPLSPDTDGDGMPDGWEVSNNLNPLLPADAALDPDTDLLANLGEYLNLTDPWNPDTDNDSMPDGWEVRYGFDPLDPSDAERDADGDGLTNLMELQLGTDPRNNDTDGDGLGDAEELEYGTNPLVPDTDGEGISDGTEVHGVASPVYANTTYFTNATERDTDSDGLTDYQEVFVYFTDPNNPDTDSDGLFDGTEVDPQKYAAKPTNATNPDTDGDGIPDGWEYFNGEYVDYHWAPDPNNASDAQTDLDGDGLTNYQEYLSGTDPWNPDTDGDGMPDGWELHYSLNPLDPSDAYEDNDAAGEDGGIYYWVNLVEYQHNTDPNNPDTDFDGIIDPLDPYPNNQRSDAGWPYPWLMGTISSDTLLFNITTDGTSDAIRYWKLASFDRYDGYWWYPSDTPEVYDGRTIDTEVSETYYPGTSHSYEVHLNNTLFSPTSSFIYMLPSDGIIPTALHTTAVNGTGLKIYPETGEFQSEDIPESYTFNATTYHLYQSDVETGSVPLFRTDLLTLPSSVPSRLLDLSRNVTANYTSVYGKIAAIRDFLRMNYRYNDTPSPPPEGHDAVDWFLFNRREGTTADFASAFCLMARLNNIPTRVAVGFRPGTTADGHNYSVTLGDLHLWDEVLFYNMGWVELDVTSPYFIGPGDGWPAAGDASIVSYPQDITPAYSSVRNLTVNVTHVSDSSVVRGEGQIIVEGFVVDDFGTAVPSVPVSVYLNSSDGQTLLRLGSVTTNDNGYYRAVCLIPWNASLGSGTVVARAHGLNDETNLRSYLPAWSRTFSSGIVITARLYIDLSAPSVVFNGSSMPVTGSLTDWNLRAYSGFNVSLRWDGEYLSTFSTNESGNFNITLVINDTAGRHYLSARFNGTSLIYPASGTETVVVRHNLTLNMSVVTENVSAGSEAVFSGTIMDGDVSPSLVDGSISGMWLIYEGAYVARSDINSTGFFLLNFTLPSDTVPGVKNVSVYFPESDFYGWVYLPLNLTVYGNCTVSIGKSEGVRNSTVSIEGVVRNLQSMPLRNMSVILYVNGSEEGVAVTGPDGSFSIPYHIPADTPGGPLNISVSTLDENYYFASEAESSITVTVPTVIDVHGMALVKGDSFNITGSLETELGGSLPDGRVSVFWDRMNIGTAEVRNGLFSLPYNVSVGDPGGVISVTATFDGSGFYLNSTGTGDFTVFARTSLVFLPIDDAVAGRNVTISGRLYEDDLSPVSSVPVYLELAGENWTAITSANGTFVSVHRLGNISAGHYSVRAYFNGSDSSYLLRSSAAGEVRVREESYLSIVLPDRVTREFEIRVRLTGQQGEVLAGQEIVLLTNRTYTAVTNSTGWATVPVYFAGNESGIMGIKVMFNGTELYLPASANSTALLFVEGGISGSLSGVMAVSMGLAVAVIAVLLYFVRKGRMKAIKEAMDRAIYHLEVRDDYHRIVFETYRHLIKLLKRYGYLKQDWQTVREFQQALREAIPGISERNLKRIFDIFEEARYSHHRISEEEPREIKAAFEDFRSEIIALMEARK